jgi:hypothetical protein
MKTPQDKFDTDLSDLKIQGNFVGPNLISCGKLETDIISKSKASLEFQTEWDMGEDKVWKEAYPGPV